MNETFSSFLSKGKISCHIRDLGMVCYTEMQSILDVLCHLFYKMSKYDGRNTITCLKRQPEYKKAYLLYKYFISNSNIAIFNNCRLLIGKVIVAEIFAFENERKMLLIQQLMKRYFYHSSLVRMLGVVSRQ